MQLKSRLVFLHAHQKVYWDCIELGHGHDQPFHAGCGIDLLKNK